MIIAVYTDLKTFIMVLPHTCDSSPSAAASLQQEGKYVARAGESTLNSLRHSPCWCVFVFSQRRGQKVAATVTREAEKRDTRVNHMYCESDIQVEKAILFSSGAINLVSVEKSSISTRLPSTFPSVGLLHKFCTTLVREGAERGKLNRKV